MSINKMSNSEETSEHILQKMSIAFPEYFREDPCELGQDVLKGILAIPSEAALISALDETRIPYKRMSFHGSLKGRVEGISYAQGGYSTVANGWGDYFWMSKSQKGDTIEHDGIEWIVAWNSYSRGDVYTFSSHSLILIPAKLY